MVASNADLNRMYPMTIKGDTLIVTPAGDAAGFSPATMRSENRELDALINMPGVRHLVIDLTHSNYYGSIVIGELVALGQAFHRRGGRIALAGPSADMREVLRIMKLDLMWEIYDSLGMALQAIAEISWQEKFWDWRFAWGPLVALLLVGLLWLLYPRPDVNPWAYEELAELYEDAVQHLQTGEREQEWERTRQRLLKRLAPVSDQLERRAAYDLTSRDLYVAARISLPSALDLAMDPQKQPTRDFLWNLACANYRMRGELIPENLQPSDIPKPISRRRQQQEQRGGANTTNTLRARGT